MKMKKRFLSILLSLVMVLGLMPGMSLTAYAATDTYTNLIPTTSDDATALAGKVVHFNGYDWYIIKDDSTASDAGTVTLLARDSITEKVHNRQNSEAIAYLDGLTTGEGPFASVAEVIVGTDRTNPNVSGSKFYLLSNVEANDLPESIRKAEKAWWLHTFGGPVGIFIVGVDGRVNQAPGPGSAGVRPAIKLDLSKVTFDSTTNTFSVLKKYPLWVGGTQVTSANAGNIDGNNKASYDAATKTLTLNGYSYTGQGHPDSDEGYSGSIYAGSGIDLNIVLSGTNSVTIDNSPIGTACAIFVRDNLTITGSGALNAHGKTHGIYSTKTITINGGSVTAESPTNGISAWNGIDITDGTVKTKGDSIGLSTPGGALRISGGEVTAEGKNHGGFVASTVSITGGKAITSGKNGILEADVIIEGGELIASGEEMGIHTYSTTDNNVRNAITGTGWSDTAGTQGKATIAISTEGQNLSSYKKVQFPAVPDPSMVATAPTGKSLSHNAQPQPLVNPGTASGGTMEYALGKDDVTAPTDGWSTEIPTGTDPGTYYVWYKVVGDENHNNVEPACVVVTIEAPAAAPAEPESVSDYTLLASMKTSGNKALKLKWTAVSGAEGYDVFFGDCGGGECTLEKTVTGQSCKIGKLKKGNAYKAFVKAWKTENGQKVYIGEASPDVHAVAGGKSNKFTNAKKITVKKKNLTVAVGGSKKIKASLKKFSNSRRYLNHTAKIRYYSSDHTVATVNAKGKVTGVAPGTCTVYAVAENGLRKGVKITVK